jgi:hypothetical protein
MSQDSNRWLKMAGLLSEAVDPSENTLNEAAEPKQDTVLVEEKVRKMVRKQIKSMLAERAARKEDISYLQGILNTLLGDNTVDVDGMLGPQTANAIAQLQRDSGLEADGVVGRQTYAAMASALDAKGMDSDLVLGELMADVPVIGRSGLVSAPASDRDIEMPVINLTANDPASDKAVADALVAVTGDASLAAKVGIQPEDRAAVAAALGQGDVKIASVDLSGKEMKVDIAGPEPRTLTVTPKPGLDLPSEPEQLSTDFMSGNLLVDFD